MNWTIRMNSMGLLSRWFSIFLRGNSPRLGNPLRRCLFWVSGGGSPFFKWKVFFQLGYDNSARFLFVIPYSNLLVANWQSWRENGGGTLPKGALPKLLMHWGEGPLTFFGVVLRWFSYHFCLGIYGVAAALCSLPADSIWPWKFEATRSHSGFFWRKSVWTVLHQYVLRPSPAKRVGIPWAPLPDRRKVAPRRHRRHISHLKDHRSFQCRLVFAYYTAKIRQYTIYLSKMLWHMAAVTGTWPVLPLFQNSEPWSSTSTVDMGDIWLGGAVWPDSHKGRVGAPVRLLWLHSGVLRWPFVRVGEYHCNWGNSFRAYVARLAIHPRAFGMGRWIICPYLADTENCWSYHVTFIYPGNYQ